MRALFEFQPAGNTQKIQYYQSWDTISSSWNANTKPGIDNTCNSLPSHVQHLEN